MVDDLIEGLLKLSLKISVMEKELGMPLNSLSSILKKTKPFPPKWIKPVQDFLEKKQISVSCAEGCREFLDKSIKHVPDCFFYPGSLSELYDQAHKQLDECEARGNALINAARGRDASGVNEDEFKAKSAPKSEKPADTKENKQDGVKEAENGLNADREVVEKQIAAVRAEKIPENRSKTSLGIKSWNLDQKKRIQELENQLK